MLAQQSKIDTGQDLPVIFYLVFIWYYPIQSYSSPWITE